MKFPLIYHKNFYRIINRIRAGHFCSTYREEGVLSLLSPPSSHYYYSFPRTCIRETLQLKNLTNSLLHSIYSNISKSLLEVFLNTKQSKSDTHPYLVSVLDKFLYTFSTKKSTTKYIKSHNILYLIHLPMKIL